MLSCGYSHRITRIAQIETQARKGAFRTVNLVEIASEVVELYDAAAEQDGTRLTVVGDREVLVTGDRDLIFDAIANLVDNAIKHGRPGGQVVVANENIDGRPVVSIADDGPGIPADEYEHVFKRFYRLEHSRYTPGNGLGLSLVAAVARLHGARIEMHDNSPGLKLSLGFRGRPVSRELATRRRDSKCLSLGQKRLSWNGRFWRILLQKSFWVASKNSESR